MRHVICLTRILFRQPEQRQMVEFFHFVLQKSTAAWIYITLITDIDMCVPQHGRFLKFLCRFSYHWTPYSMLLQMIIGAKSRVIRLTVGFS